MKSSSEISEICRKYGIVNYTINEDGSIDVNENVNLIGKSLTELPLTFNRVNRNFDCGFNYLTTLKGYPKYVGSGFYCHNNKLTSLEYGPVEVGADFSCVDNKYLNSLEHSPKKVGGDFYCGECPLKDLYGISDNIGGIIDVYGTSLQSIINEPVDIDFIKRFNSYKVIKDGRVDLKRLKYLMEVSEMDYDIDKIKRYYEII